MHSQTTMHIQHYQIEKQMIRNNTNCNISIRIEEFNGRPIKSIFKNKSYKKRILNKWHLLIMLNKNKQLIQFRKYNFSK